MKSGPTIYPRMPNVEKSREVGAGARAGGLAAAVGCLSFPERYFRFRKSVGAVYCI